MNYLVIPAYKPSSYSFVAKGEGKELAANHSGK